jgi:ribosome-associated protein
LEFTSLISILAKIFYQSIEIMRKTKKNSASDALVKLVVHGMQEKKATGILVMDLRKVSNAFSDFFVICSANSDTQVDAIKNSVEDEVYKAIQENAWHSEGQQQKEWILLDYSDVIVHIFRKDRRRFYGLEDLWGDAELTEIAD